MKLIPLFEKSANPANVWVHPIHIKSHMDDIEKLAAEYNGKRGEVDNNGGVTYDFTPGKDARKFTVALKSKIKDALFILQSDH